MTLSEAQADDILKQLLLMARAQVAAKVELHGWKLEYVLRNNPDKAAGDWYATCPTGQKFRSFIRLKKHTISPPEPPPPSPGGDGTSEWATGAMALLTSLPPLSNIEIGRLEHAISPWLEEAKARHLGLTVAEQRKKGKPQKVKILDTGLDSSRSARAMRRREGGSFHWKCTARGHR